MSDLDVTKSDLGVFWPSECDANIWCALASINLHLQEISPIARWPIFFLENNVDPKKIAEMQMKKITDLKNKIYRFEMVIPSLQIGPSSAGLQKKIASQSILA